MSQPSLELVEVFHSRSRISFSSVCKPAKTRTRRDISFSLYVDFAHTQLLQYNPFSKTQRPNSTTPTFGRREPFPLKLAVQIVEHPRGRRPSVSARSCFVACFRGPIPIYDPNFPICPRGAQAPLPGRARGDRKLRGQPRASLETKTTTLYVRPEPRQRQTEAQSG